MAVLRQSPPCFLLILTLTSLILHSSPAHAQTCSSEKFTNKKVYSNCTDLPTLNSTLHWTYSGNKSTLSFAFTAPPATPNGWVAWAINPNGTGMAGSQSFIAFKDSKGMMIVKTYNISSYASIVEGKIVFDVTESSAEFSGGVMRIFATVELPETMTEVNHIWQVGGSVVNGFPAKHEFLPANLNAKGKLELTGKGGVPGSPAVAPTPPNASSGSVNAGVYGIVVVIGCLIGFF